MSWRSFIAGVVLGAIASSAIFFWFVPQADARNAERMFRAASDQGDHALACDWGERAASEWAAAGKQDKYVELRGETAVECLLAQ